MGWGENDRGVSFTFGAEVVAKFLHKHDFDLICRAHQVSYSVYQTRWFEEILLAVPVCHYTYVCFRLLKMDMNFLQNVSW